MSKIMKRLCCIGVMFVLVFGMSACGAKETEQPEKEPDKKIEAEDDQKEPEKEPETETGEESGEFVRGTIEGNHYENEWLNMRADFPDDYVMATAEEIAQMQQTGSEMLMNEEGQEKVDQAANSEIGGPEMTAVNLAGVPNCTLSVEKLPLQNFTAEQYLEASKKLLEASITEDIPMTIHEEMPTVSIAGEDYLCLEIEMDVQGTKMNSYNYARIKDGYAVTLNVTFTPDTADKKDEVLAAFQKMD